MRWNHFQATNIYLVLYDFILLNKSKILNRKNSSPHSYGVTRHTQERLRYRIETHCTTTLNIQIYKFFPYYNAYSLDCFFPFFNDCCNGDVSSSCTTGIRNRYSLNNDASMIKSTINFATFARVTT
jgi:hypothetical protein